MNNPDRLPDYPNEDGYHFFGNINGQRTVAYWRSDLQRFDSGTPNLGLRLETCEHFWGPYLGRAVLEIPTIEKSSHKAAVETLKDMGFVYMVCDNLPADKMDCASYNY